MTQKSMLVIESCTNSSSSSICASVTASAVRFVLPSSSSSVLSAGGLCFAMNCNVRGMTSAPQEPDRNTQLPLSNVYFCEKRCFAKRHNSLTITNRRQMSSNTSRKREAGCLHLSPGSVPTAGCNSERASSPPAGSPLPSTARTPPSSRGRGCR